MLIKPLVIGKNKMKMSQYKSLFRSSTPLIRNEMTPKMHTRSKENNVAISEPPKSDNHLISHGENFRAKRELLKNKRANLSPKVIINSNVKAEYKNHLFEYKEKDMNKNNKFIQRLTSLNEELNQLPKA